MARFAHGLGTRTPRRYRPMRAGSASAMLLLLRAVGMDIPSCCPYAPCLDGEERTNDSAFRSRRARPRGDGRQSSPDAARKGVGVALYTTVMAGGPTISSGTSGT